MEPLPIKKKHGMCLKVDRKEKLKKKKKKTGNRGGTGWYQRQWYIFFLQGGSFFILGSSLSMSRFLHLLFSLVISCFKR